LCGFPKRRPRPTEYPREHELTRDVRVVILSNLAGMDHTEIYLAFGAGALAWLGSPASADPSFEFKKLVGAGI